MGGGRVIQALQLVHREQHSLAGPWLPEQLKVQDAMHLMPADQLIAKRPRIFLAPEDWRETREQQEAPQTQPNNEKSLFP